MFKDNEQQPEGFSVPLSEALDNLAFNDAGLVPVIANYQCRLGEVDLIMDDGETLVFVEVRWRAYNRYGGALASVDGRKQRRLILAARHYLGRYPYQAQRPCRFDVLGLEPDDDGEVRYHWVQNAFYGDQ